MLLPEYTESEEYKELYSEDVDIDNEEERPEDYEILPTKTYRLDFENGRILGTVEDEESVLQFVRKVLNTDKYAHVIYDWYYGHELLNLVGMPYEYAVAEIPRIVEEALLTDDRIDAVEDFIFTRNSLNTMTVSFTVVSVYSTIDYEMEVEI